MIMWFSVLIAFDCSPFQFDPVFVPSTFSSHVRFLSQKRLFMYQFAAKS